MLSRKSKKWASPQASRDHRCSQNDQAAHAPLPSEFEPFERRLVLSAQLLFDVLGDHAIDMHDALVTGDHIETPATCATWESEPADNASLPSTIGIGGGIGGGIGDQQTSQHLREAHQATGWNEVQSEFGLTGRGQTVAVIDSGIAWDHQSLGEGYGAGYRVVGGWDFTEENDSQPYDDGPMGFHGTHVAGIIGSDNATHSGVAPEVDLVALRVFNDQGGGQLSWVENALAWVHDNQDTFENPITTVNLSLGTNWNSDSLPSWATLEDELAALAEDGIVVTASAGNSFADFGAPGLSYPAASPNVLPVASADDDGSLSDFSQRHQRALVAPGGNILSTVPDHVYGSDGTVDDFAPASGTSMSAPYVAGASVLVRQAMEMVGISDINVSTIGEHLRATADSVWDSATGAHYDSLNLQAAIDALLPDDTVGDTFGSGSVLTSLSTSQDGWLNALDDQDTYTFTAQASGQLDISTVSEWVDDLSWTLQTSSGTEITASGNAGQASIIAGQSYQIHVSSADSIGPFSLNVDFSQSSLGGGASGSGESSPTSLGTVEHTVVDAADGTYSFEAARDGIVTVEWTGQANGEQLTAIVNGQSYSDATPENGVLRLDIPSTAGQSIQFAVPGGNATAGSVEVANVLSLRGNVAFVSGTNQADAISVDLSDGASVNFEGIHYSFSDGSLGQLHSNSITSLEIDARGGNDALDVVGSGLSDKVDLRPDLSTLENRDFAFTSQSTEQVNYQGGGGADRVYLYDSDTDDTLRARPRHVTLEGVGYGFEVTDVDRIFMHATGAGEDYAYLYDSAGDDRLSMRPQFASISGDGFFNYVRGFERVYAYATAGGTDEALLYDSEGSDRFNTSGQSASIVGPGFSSFSRGFESVQAVAQSGGNDTASLYGDASVQWQRGSDFVEMTEGEFSREARGFHQVQTYEAGQLRAASETSPIPSSPLDHKLESAIATLQAGVSIDSAAASPDHAPNYHSQAPTGTPAIVDSFSGISSGPDASNASDSSPEEQLLQEVQEVRSWIVESAENSARWDDRLDLPEEALLEDPSLQAELLDEVFRAFEDS